MTASVCIVGLGLVGGSLGMALRRSGWRVSYVDPAVPLEVARAAGAADEKLRAVEGDFVVLATAVDVAMRKLAQLGGSPALVTSVCSVMTPLRAAAAGLSFVAGHPFAGSEKSGLAAARPDLFAGRPWFVERSEPRVEQLIAAAGATAVVIDAEEHDRTLALTSHLPQIVATALATLFADVDPRFVGSGARSLLRLAGSSHEIWGPILENNRENVDAAIERLVLKMRDLTPADFERAREMYERTTPRED